MTLSEAQSQHASAWAAIQDRIRGVATAATADFLPVIAEVVEQDGQQVLRVVCLTNDIQHKGRDTCAMVFAAPLAGPQDSLVH